jgi:serine/threonine-protein kinase HipA
VIVAALDELWVYVGERKVGFLYDERPLAFRYDEAWLAQTDAFSIGAIPLEADVQRAREVEACFENLLPEGDIRDYLATQNQTSTVFGLLRALAGDTAGGLLLLPPGQMPDVPHYTETSWASIAATLSKPGVSAIDLYSRGTRISLAGAQDKATLAIFDGIPMLPEGNSPSTHILKPDIYRLKKVWESAANEAIVMRTAAKCGLLTAPVFYQSTTRSCVVERFDRQLIAPRHPIRLPQYDFCQLAGIASDLKYEQEGGPGIADCARLIRRHSSFPAVDLRRFVEWIFFNLYTGNNDSHAKNLSMHRLPDGSMRLTPHYDLMCTRLYPGLSQRFAFKIGTQDAPGVIGHADVTAMARELDIQPAFVGRLATQLAKRLPDALDAAISELSPDLGHKGQPLASKLSKTVKSFTHRIAQRIADPNAKAEEPWPA